MTPLRTPRLLLRPLESADAGFIHALMNDEAWLAQIGDRGIRTLDDAGRYLQDGPWTRYAELGFGHFAVERLDEAGPIGVCGLAQRPHLAAPDLGFAFLPAHRGAGYAAEAAQAMLAFAADLGLPRVLATVRPGNEPSWRLLSRLGMAEQSRFISPASGQEVLLYSIDLPVQQRGEAAPSVGGAFS